MKIAFLGASLSAQTVNHKTGEITGYVEAFRQKYAKTLQINPKDIGQFAYGGNRLSDAGFIRLEELIKTKPDLCVVEPIVEDVSRGVEANELDYVHVFKRLIENNITPLVFCVPLPIDTKVLESPRYNFCYKVCSKYDIPMKTVDLSKAHAAGLVFKGLHTNNSTAEFLASQLSDFIQVTNSIAVQKNLSNIDFKSCISIQELANSNTKNIRSISVDFKARKAGRLTLIQKQNIGPYSPILDISISQESSNEKLIRKEKSVWDRFCYYQRSSYVTICDVQLEAGTGNILINISDKKPKYTTCKKFEGNWPNLSELKLDPLGVITSISNFEIDFIDLKLDYSI